MRLLAANKDSSPNLLEVATIRNFAEVVEVGKQLATSIRFALHLLDL